MRSCVYFKNYVMYLFLSPCCQSLISEQDCIDEAGTDSVLVTSLQP